MITRYLRFPGGKSKALTFSYDDSVEQDKHRRLITDGTIIHNPNLRSVWIGKQNGTYYEIKAGQTVRL